MSLREQGQMILCMDFAGKKVNVTRLEDTRGQAKSNKGVEAAELRVVESLELDPSDVGEYLRGKCENAREVRVSGPLEKTFHKVFILPDLKQKMLKSAVRAEVAKAFGNDYQFSYQDLGEVTGPGNQVNRKTMIAGIKRDGLEELSQTFAGSRIRPRMYTTYPTAVRELLKKLGILSEEPIAFMELSHPTTRIIIFKGDEIRLTREVSVLEEAKDPGHSGLERDVYRTVLFYNETYPDERVNKLVFAGNSSTLEMQQNLSQKTGAELVPFKPEGVFETEGEMLHLHPGCLGLALLDSGPGSFEFVPLSVQEKGKLKRILVLSSSVCLAVVLVFAVIISRFSFDLSNLNAFHGGIKGEIKMKEDRLKEMPLEFVAQTIETSQPPWSDILLELAAVVPEGVALKTLTLRNAKRTWRGEVTAMASGSDEISSLLQVEETQNNFAKSPLFSGIKLTKRELQGKRVSFQLIYQLDI
jgi:Tfp pilus assembly PilM family ATPase